MAMFIELGTVVSLLSAAPSEADVKHYDHKTAANTMIWVLRLKAVRFAEATVIYEVETVRPFLGRIIWFSGQESFPHFVNIGRYVW